MSNDGGGMAEVEGELRKFFENLEIGRLKSGISEGGLFGGGDEAGCGGGEFFR
jgi:hypothetical protein